MTSPTQQFSLKGKTALVTGATDGIGKSIAAALSAHGARVVVSSRRSDACRDVAAELCDAGGEAIGIPCNVSRRGEIDAMLEQIAGTWGGLDTVVLNAAVNPHYGPLSTLSDEAYAKTIDTNLGNALYLCNRAIPPMAERRDGSVIIISSIAAARGSSTIGIYSISKAADSALARSLAVEWGDRNVRVNCIAPGIIRTKLSRKRWEDPQRLEETLRTTPLGRLGEPEDISGLAVLLASPAGRFITGQTIFVDGGITIGGG